MTHRGLVLVRAACTAPFLSAHSMKPTGAFFTPEMFAILIFLICCQSAFCRFADLKSALLRSLSAQLSPGEITAHKIGFRSRLA